MRVLTGCAGRCRASGAGLGQAALTRPRRFAGATVWRSVTEPITEIVRPNPVSRYAAAISTPELSRDDEALTSLAAGASLRLRPVTGGGLHLTPAGDGHPAVLATLLAITYDAQRDGTWARLKICHHDACRWAFFDESRSRTATWCAMGICGNRTKVAAYRRRQAAK